MSDDPFAGGPPADDPHSDAGRSLAERAAAAAGLSSVDLEAGEQAELFPSGVIEGDERVTLKTLIPPGSTVKQRVGLGSMSNLPLRGGLLDPTREVRIIVRCWPQNYKENPKGEDLGDGTRNIEEWEQSFTLKPNHAEVLGNWQAGLNKMFKEGLRTNATEAGKALEELQDIFTEYMTTGEIPNGPLS
jgi:hypothetical protein